MRLQLARLRKRTRGIDAVYCIDRPAIKPWWLLVAFLSGMAVALGTGELILNLRENRLELSAPKMHFLSGQPLARLHNAEEVPIDIQVTLYSGTKSHVFHSTQQRCVFSFNLWADKKPFSVAKLEPARQRKDNLSDRDAEDWCLSSSMIFDMSGLSITEPLWVSVDARVEVPQRNGGVLGGSVSESGVSLTNGLAALVEILSRPPQSGQARWTLTSDKFTLADLKRNGRGT
jgi:hypothetical protein